MSAYAEGQRPPCTAKHPGCLGVIVDRNAKTCKACYDYSRAHQLDKPQRERLRIEDRLLDDVKAFLRTSQRKPPILKPTIHKGNKAEGHEMVLCLSDTHYPEVVDPLTAMGLTYNSDVCTARLAQIRDTAIRYKDLRSTSYPVRKLTVAVLGDMLSGDIHEELEITNQFPMSEALVKLAYLIDSMGRAFAEEFPEVEFIFMPGNHPRLSKKPRHKAKWNNWDYVLGHFVAALSDKQYLVQVPKDIIYIHHVFETRIGMVHGDGVSSASFAGIPWYGMKSRRDAIQALLRHLGQPGIDYLLMGHFHQLLYWQGTDCDLLINGAVKGGDEYSIDTRHSSTDPVQALLTFHPKHGLTDLSRINLKGI
jgi:predicted phosphodiesterase